MTEQQKAEIKDLLWDYLKRDSEHKDRRRTGWGTKTLDGLCACIQRIAEDRGPHAQPDPQKALSQ